MTTMLERSEEMVDKQVRGKYTLEYKLEAVRQVKAGQSGAVVAKVLGIPSVESRAKLSQASRPKLSH